MGCRGREIDLLNSPYDPAAHYARKHTTSWIGHEVHLTESCDDDRPHLITNIETASGSLADGKPTTPMHEALAARALSPTRYIVDTGYHDAEFLVTSATQFAVDLLGQARPDQRWQAHSTGGFDTTQFPIDWARQVATCAAGHESLSWTPAVGNGTNSVIKIKFSRTHCQPCPLKQR